MTAYIDGSYDVDGQWWVDVHSRGRGLLALFLFADISGEDAPTELLVGSHLDVPRVLAPFRAQGVFFGDVDRGVPGSDLTRLRARATGRGWRCLCLPSLPRCIAEHGRTTVPGPRMVAEPAIAHCEPFALRDGAAVCAVEQGDPARVSGNLSDRTEGGVDYVERHDQGHHGDRRITESARFGG